MKNRLLFSAALSLAFFANAQVLISDAYFRKSLQDKVPQCFVGDLLDTTKAKTISELQVYSNRLKDLKGIEYFKGLKKLICNSNDSLTTLPILPNSLEFIDATNCKMLSTITSIPLNLKNLTCYGSALKNIPSLPATLEVLDCSINELSSLPVLPPALDYLICHSNKLTHLPNFPDNLSFVNCENNLITSLPAIPKQMSINASHNKLTSLPDLSQAEVYNTIINCSYNQITEFPLVNDRIWTLNLSNNFISYIPWGLTQIPQTLNLAYNQLETLPKFPFGLQSLDCSNNKINYIADFDSTLWLKYFDCSFNKLTSLPNFPNNLNNLICYGNQLNSLGALPNGLNSLDCTENPMQCLPFLPNDLSYLATDVSCIPNNPLSLSSTLPVCSPANNLHHCQYFPTVKGNIFVDKNNNSMKDAGDVNCPNIKIIAEPGNLYSFSNNNGYFDMAVDSLGSFIFHLENLKYYTSYYQSLDFTSYDEQIDYDIKLYPNGSIVDLSTELISFNGARPGFPLYFDIHYANIGTISTSYQTNFTFPPSFMVDSVTKRGTVSAGTVTWTNATFAPFEHTTVRVYGHLLSSTPIGSTLTFTSLINPNNTTDIDNSNNKDEVELVVRGSFDPNDKEATPSISPFQIAKGDYVYYTVRFQNTGNDTAFTVVIIDTLSEKLDFNTLEMIASSHNCQASVKNGVATFEFPKVNLLWSSINDPLSHGYVRFRIKPKSSLTESDIISNKAEIYFDYNAPIVTNSAQTVVQTPIITELDQEKFKTQVALFPNPTKGDFNILFCEKGNLEIYDMGGLLLFKQVIEQSGQQFSISKLKSGTYLYRLVMDNNVRNGKLVKE